MTPTPSGRKPTSGESSSRLSHSADTHSNGISSTTALDNATEEVTNMEQEQQAHLSLQDTRVPYIDPPEGFEATCLDNLSSTNHNTLNGIDDNSGSDTISSRGSGSSGTNNKQRPMYAALARQPTRGSSSSDNMHDNGGPTPTTSDIAANGIEPTSSSTNDNIANQDIDNNYSNLTKEPQPTPSTSSAWRFREGLNNVVTKLTKAFASTSLSIINTDRCAQDETPEFAFGNKRALEKTWKLMDKVVRRCQKPRMNLNNSPPFILDILPETYQHLKLIHTNYGPSQEPPVNDNEYSQVFLKNLQNRCVQVLKLFKEARDEMFDEESDYRHKLTRNTLLYNHILSELRAIFPNGKFIGEKYLITKKETAGEFWRSNFGTSVLVDWKSFYHALQQVHSIDSSFFSLNALKQTIDLTCDDHISIFEFDVFTRLFQPWSTLLRNWQILAVTHPGYKAFLTYDELKSRLQKHIDKPGSYVFRLSCTRLGQWAIGYVTQKGEILQTIVQNISLSQALTETKVYLYPDGKDEDPTLSALFSRMGDEDRNVTVTEEQYEIYCGVGNSFQTCKICFENDKDIRVEPCNHLLCTSCLLAWQECEGQACPFCRTEIKETVQITINRESASDSQV